MNNSDDLTLPMDIMSIEKCIPHRYPFLLIDRVTELEPKKHVVATKAISIADPILQGHFPDFPIFPGVLLVEAMAQASAVLGHFSKEGGLKEVLLAEVGEARFKRKVVPGDQLELRVELIKVRAPFAWFTGTATVDGELAAKAKFSALIS